MQQQVATLEPQLTLTIQPTIQLAIRMNETADFGELVAGERRATGAAQYGKGHG